MIQKILIFILFLGPLVFFHELGHFFFARFFGVRVEVFSIGFGPKLFSFTRGDTKYAISAIPLGGYVKMYGDDPFNKDDVPAEEQKHSFTHKNKWQRFWIVLGGPLANMLFAYVIFFGLLMSGEKVPEIRAGQISQETFLYKKGLRTGDFLKYVNGKEIRNPSDLALEGGGYINTLGVDRNGKDVELNLKMNGEKFFNIFSQFPPILRKPILVNDKGEKFFFSLSETRPTEKESFEEIKESFKNEIFLLDFKNQKKHSSVKLNQNLTFEKALSEKKLWPLDLVVDSVNMNSPADKAGIIAKDIIYQVNGKDVYSFTELRESLQKADSTEPVGIKILRKEKSISLILKPEIIVENKIERKIIGVRTAAQYVRLKLKNVDGLGFFGALKGGLVRTWENSAKTLVGFKKLIFGETSLKNIGGPLSIAQVASDSFNMSITYFFQLMALISINLGIINLFPIPVLDGGHIVFIFLEFFNGGPLSRKKMEIAQQLGLSLLLILMVGAIFNDVSRIF